LRVREVFAGHQRGRRRHRRTPLARGGAGRGRGRRAATGQTAARRAGTPLMLRFGTAGLRGPLRAGQDGMNAETVARATAGVSAWLRERCLGGGRVVVGRDARHGSAEFATVTAEIFQAAGFPVTLLPRPLPTPVLAYAVRALGAVAGVQITASHNPAGDNGYKLYLEGGSQLVAPAATETEARISAALPPFERAPVVPADDALLRGYLARVAELPARIGGDGPRAPVRSALTPMHGVGGETALQALA